MPALVAQNQEKETIVRLKRVYSGISQATLPFYTEGGAPSGWGVETSKDVVSTQLKFIKTCDTGVAGCWGSVNYNINGAFYWNMPPEYSFAILADGTALAFSGINLNCSGLGGACEQILVDVNGTKAPNTFGKDIFSLLLFKDKVAPRGIPDGHFHNSFENYCVKQGHSCAGWILINENQDYLKCPEQLSWTGKHKCD
jgi:hypothetical protein